MTSTTRTTEKTMTADTRRSLLFRSTEWNQIFCARKNRPTARSICMQTAINILVVLDRFLESGDPYVAKDTTNRNPASPVTISKLGPSGSSIKVNQLREVTSAVTAKMTNWPLFDVKSVVDIVVIVTQRNAYRLQTRAQWPTFQSSPSKHQMQTGQKSFLAELR